jgi:hypothetical protein
MQEALAQPALAPEDFDAGEPPSDDDDGFSGSDNMPAVGRERFWLPAANRYPFKTLLALKRMKLGRAKRATDPAGLRAERLARLKAFASGGQVPYRRLRFRARKVRVPGDFDAPLPSQVLEGFGNRARSALGATG